MRHIASLSENNNVHEHCKNNFNSQVWIILEYK